MYVHIYVSDEVAISQIVTIRYLTLQTCFFWTRLPPFRYLSRLRAAMCRISAHSVLSE